MLDRSRVKIVVLSPGRRQGTTTLSILIGMIFESTQNLKVCLTTVGKDNDSISAYLGRNIIPDVTRSLEQVYKLLASGQISPSDIVDYSQRLSGNFYLFDTVADYMSQEASNALLLKVMGYLDFDIIITDINDEIDSDVTQQLIKESNLVLIVFEQAKDMVKKMKAWRQSEYYDVIDTIGELFVINRFDRNVSSLKEWTKVCGINWRFAEKICDCAYIRKISNQGKLLSLMSNIRNHDVRTLGLTSDLKRLVHKVCNNSGIFFIDWEKREAEKLLREKETLKVDKERYRRR